MRMRYGPGFIFAKCTAPTTRRFAGFNRAQAAVIEGAILVSRLSMLPREKVEGEMQYLGVAVQKTAGPREREAWSWLVAAAKNYHHAKETPS